MEENAFGPFVPRRLLTRERGQILLIVALAALGLLALTGLVVDGGLLYLSRRQAQNAADAAALAGAKTLSLTWDDVQARNTALYYAGLNGFDNDGVQDSVHVAHPPDAGEFAGNPNFIRVTIVVTNPTYFIHLVYGGPARASASSTAGVEPCPPAPSVMTLHPSACQAFDMRGNATLRVLQGGVIVNSACQSDALYATGNVQLVSDGCILVTGKYRVDGASATVHPRPNIGVTPTANPLASTPLPDLAGLPIRHGTPHQPRTLRILHGDVTLSPGIYYGGIEILANASVTLEPGLYVMAGGGLEIRANATVTGQEVCIYNTQAPDYPEGDGAFGAITLQQNTSINLTPPTSGPYAGLVFFQDPANPREMYITGDATLDAGGGTIYLPGARLHLAGNATSNAPFIALTFLAEGNARMTVRPTIGQGAGGLGAQRVFLAE